MMVARLAARFLDPRCLLPCFGVVIDEADLGAYGAGIVSSLPLEIAIQK
jgi:hypothetical protein